ncbi:hypothetical protein [Lactococcus garvieae]|uniref:hypothetical protein n=1 Tax=Lactococcus garvieae TaxID=1363 RepID=UPI0002F67750|nr:hypothetical protein [Lactococcus garvieae]
MEFKFSDKTIEMFNELSKNIVTALDEKAIREQIELQGALKDTAKHGKILYTECLKQGFDKSEAMAFTLGFLTGISK